MDCLLEMKGQVALVTINRPPMNTLSRSTLSELAAIFNELEKDDSIRSILLTGAGDRVFSAGADISEFGDMSDQEQSRANIQHVHDFFLRLEQFPKPIIACVNGKALGGGNELQMACHLAIASEEAEFGLPEVRLGIIPGYGGTQRLPRLIGRRRAVELMLSGERISAQKALGYGMINRVVPHEDLMDEAIEWAARLAEGPPLAMKGILDSVNRGSDLPITEGTSIELEHIMAVRGSEDAIEGVTAFFTKRKAEFKGK
ncbi:enoyl-CoA hydratase/isomerase family protein [Neobacillus muris]|uniref:enoyl-CoA hydratase/isomerase family protein n=1 Tax=Neobacillus muris TaxID=2941334 RepID=UPI00203DAA9E|nr:enoyl-CoA hydratase-related protein [Neobacillus muris]